MPTWSLHEVGDDMKSKMTHATRAELTDAIRAYVRIYSLTVILALLIGAAYLVYWGIVGLRTWA